MENQRKDMIGLQPTEPDLLYQKPTNYARRKPMEQTKQEQFIIRRIGGTTYKAVSYTHLSASSGNKGRRDPERSLCGNGAFAGSGIL